MGGWTCTDCGRKKRKKGSKGLEKDRRDRLEFLKNWEVQDAIREEQNSIAFLDFGMLSSLKCSSICTLFFFNTSSSFFLVFDLPKISLFTHIPSRNSK